MQGSLFSNDELCPPVPAPSESSAKELANLLNSAKECCQCRLAETRLHVVFGEGNPCADLVVIGEAPGADEDASGRPFVGRSGQLLDKIL